MSVAELVLDYIQALIWPVLIAVGVWVFRRQLGALFGHVGSLFERSRVKNVEIRGVKFELEQVAEVLKESVEESREEAAKAEDPDDRERAVQKLEREAAALGHLEAAMQVGRQVTERASHHLDRAMNAVDDDRHVRDYLNRARGAVKEDPYRSSVPDPTHALRVEFIVDRSRGIPVEETIARLGPPDQWVGEWLDRLAQFEAKRPPQQPS